MTLSREEYLGGVELLAARSASSELSAPVLCLLASARLCAAAVERTAVELSPSGSGQRFLAKLALRPARSLIPEHVWGKAIMLATAALDPDPALLPSLVEEDGEGVDLMVVALQHQISAGSLEVLERAFGLSPSAVFEELTSAL